MSIKDKRGSVFEVFPGGDARDQADLLAEVNLFLEGRPYGVERFEFSRADVEGSVLVVSGSDYGKPFFVSLEFIQKAAAKSVIITGLWVYTKVPQKDAIKLGYFGRHIEPKADLRRAQLEQADLKRAQLEQADLTKANLRWAELQFANLQRADLREADLERAYITEANLQGANIQEASIQGARLNRTNLQGANLRRASLYLANLEGANLRGADLQDANLRGAKLIRANLQGASLRGAVLRGADLGGADLQSAKYNSETEADIDLSERGAIYVD